MGTFKCLQKPGGECAEPPSTPHPASAVPSGRPGCLLFGSLSTFCCACSTPQPNRIITAKRSPLHFPLHSLIRCLVSRPQTLAKALRNYGFATPALCLCRARLHSTLLLLTYGFIQSFQRTDHCSIEDSSFPRGLVGKCVGQNEAKRIPQPSALPCRVYPEICAP